MTKMYQKYVIFLVAVNVSVFNASFISNLIGRNKFTQSSPLEPSLINQGSQTQRNISSCRDKWTCDDENESFPGKGCYCDNLCGIMNDCCSNHKPNDIAIAEVFDESMFRCLNLPTLINSIEIGTLVVSMCPTNWTGPEIRKLCEQNEWNFEFKNELNNSSRVKSIFSIPLIENETGIVYKNAFCAHCHGEIGDPFAWQTGVRDGIIRGNSSNPSIKLLEGITHESKSEHTIRICVLGYIDSECRLATANINNDTISNCTFGDFALVYDVNDNIYKNVHCAICNGVQNEDIRCEPSGNRYTIPPPGFAYDNIVHIEHVSNDSDIKRLQLIKIKDYMTLYGLIISVTSLVLTLLMYSSFARLRARTGKIKICLTSSLLVAQLLCLTSDEVKDINPLICKCFAVLTHYFFLTTFCWMNVMAFDICRMFSKKMAVQISQSLTNRKMFLYSLFAFGKPFLIVLSSSLMDIFDADTSLNPRYGEGSHCWLSTTNSVLLFFLGPLGLCKIFDLIVFIKAVVHIIRTKKRTTQFGRRHGKSTCAVLICIKLSVILGLTWIIAFIARIAENDIIYLLFIMFNTLQGSFIFCCFVCNKTALFMLISKFREAKLYLNSSSTNTTNVYSMRGTEM